MQKLTEAAMGGIFVSGVLAVVSAFFMYTGVLAFVRPKVLAGSLGLSLNGASGANEMRAQYGGFFLFSGLLAAAALAGYGSRTLALIPVVVVFGGLSFGRLLSAVLDGGFKDYRGAIPALFLIDSCGFTAALAALGLEMGWLPL